MPSGFTLEASSGLTSYKHTGKGLEESFRKSIKFNSYSIENKKQYIYLLFIYCNMPV